MATANARMSWKTLHTTKLPAAFKKSALPEPSDPWEGALEEKMISFYQSYSHTCYRQHWKTSFTCCDSRTNHWLSSSLQWQTFAYHSSPLPFLSGTTMTRSRLPKALKHSKLALDINPMYEGIWFTLGLGIGWVGLWITTRSQPVELLSALRGVIITSYHIILVFSVQKARFGGSKMKPHTQPHPQRLEPVRLRQLEVYVFFSIPDWYLVLLSSIDPCILVTYGTHMLLSCSCRCALLSL